MKRLRSLAISWTAGAMNWVGDHIRYADPNAPVGFRDHLRWWLEGLLSWIFGIAYEGSAEEVRDGLQFIEDGVKDDYLTPNQREIKARLCEFQDCEVQS